MIYRNVPLKYYNTFGLDYQADLVISIKTAKEARDLFSGVSGREKPLLIMGSGSNILFISDFRGTILRPEFGGIKVEEKSLEYVVISAGSGVIWDKLVDWTVKSGYSGLENLSFIPGTVGASPVQNIGAYGVEIKDAIEKVKTINLSNGSIRFFSNKECEFGYRESIFKKKEKGKYLVIKVYYKLRINPLLNLSYGALREEVSKLGKENPVNVREAVINIRRSKLPDPELIGNAGSFFKNPVVDKTTAERLKNDFPQMPCHEDKYGSVKIAAGWLIDQCGWKGKRIGDAGVHDKQALVLVNYGNAKGTDILNLSELIKKSVTDKFAIALEREVEVVGSI